MYRSLRLILSPFVCFRLKAALSYVFHAVVGINLARINFKIENDMAQINV